MCEYDTNLYRLGLGHFWRERTSDINELTIN